MVTKTKKSKLSGEAIALTPDELLDTLSFVGCYCIHKGQAGLSFKGLPEPIEIQIGTQSLAALPGTFQPVTLAARSVAALERLLQMRSQHEALLKAELSGDDDLAELYREQVNTLFDELKARHGSLRAAIALFDLDEMPDVRLASLWALEDRNGNKTEVMFGRSLDPLPNLNAKLFEELDDESLETAIAQSISHYGGLNVDAISVWFNVHPEAIELRLLESGLCFREPILEK